MDKGSVWLFLIACCAIITYLVVVPHYFPYLGIAISLVILSNLVFFFKKNKSGFNLVIYLMTLIFSFFVVYNSNLFLTFLNIVAVLFLDSLMALPSANSDLGFGKFLISPLTVFFQSFKNPSEYKINFDLKGNSKNIIEISKSLLISLVALLVIIPLLASANPFFNKLVIDVIEIFNLRNLLQSFLAGNYAVWLVRFFVFFILTLFIPGLVTFVIKNKTGRVVIANPLSSANLFLPKLLVGLVIFTFFVTQAQLYFASPNTLQTLGYTNSQYAREIFGQLSVVALVILLLIYNDKNKKTLPSILTYILMLQGIFLAFIALKSDYDYSANWGFTSKRLWGFAVVGGLLGVFSLFLLKYGKFVRGVILLISFLLIGVNLANFDYLIFHYRKSTTHSGVDYLYLSNLSSDSQSYGELLTMLEKIKQTDNTTIWRVLTKIKRLQKNYQQLDLRTFNYSEFSQYQKIKSVNSNYSNYVISIK